MYLTEISQLLGTLHSTIDKAIADLPDEALEWRPGAGMNNLGILLAHTLGAERFWIGDVAGGEPSGRVRDDEFATTGKTVAFFAGRAREVLAHSHSVLARIAPEELGELRRVPGSGREVTVAWAVLHALEHTALHAGHIEITRQLWDQHQSLIEAG